MIYDRTIGSLGNEYDLWYTIFLCTTKL
jgi:hypothetical protein